MGRYKPKDRKNTENRVFSRYAFRSGQMHSIHGMANFQVDTQESQFFGLYSNTGQGATEGGPGTGKAVLYTPGQSLVLDILFLNTTDYSYDSILRYLSKFSCVFDLCKLKNWF